MIPLNSLILDLLVAFLQNTSALDECPYNCPLARAVLTMYPLPCLWILNTTQCEIWL